MHKKIAIAQNVKELEFILSSFEKTPMVLPVNLETLLYCLKKKLNFINLNEFISKKIHERILIETNNLIKKIIFLKSLDQNLISEIEVFLRFRIYSYKFIKYSLQEILKYKKIDYYIVSGWNEKNHSKLNVYFLKDIISHIVPKKKIINLNISKISEKNKTIVTNYKYATPSIQSTSKKKILLNNLGYNFKRIIFSKYSKNNLFYFPTFDKINFFKKIAFHFLNIRPLYFKKKSTKYKFFKLYNLNQIKHSEDSKILNIFSGKFNLHFNDLYHKNESVKKLLIKNNFNLIITNITKGIEGSISCKIKKKSTNSICIPHGTVTESFNKFDKIYKRNIAQAIFSGDAKYFAIQSKIAKNSLNTHKINGKPLFTGNLIFSSTNKQSKKILFAVTLKDFYGLQFLGVEMFYEFLENLKYLNKISKKFEYKFLIKVHPLEQKCVPYLKSIFKNLEFTNKKIDHVLKQCSMTISYSSTVIEDSLQSKIPVILLDHWNRYQHCAAEKNINKKNKAVYYINDRKNLKKAINTINKSNKINFEKYTFKGDCKKNFGDHVFSKAV